jgi:hypothetical protein
VRFLGGFIREFFTLPLIFSGIFLLCLGAEKRKSSFCFLSGVFFGLSIDSWHLAQFILLPVFIFILFDQFRSSPWSNLKWKWLLFSIPVIMCTYINPAVREKGFILSPLNILIAGITLSSVLESLKIFKSKRIILTFSILLIIFLSIIKFSGESDYSHVYSTLFYKLKFLGIKPEDPSNIPFSARIFWSGPFAPPSIDYLFSQYSPVLLLFVTAFYLQYFKTGGRHEKLRAI